MQTTIPINFTSEIVDCGFIGEHNAVELDVTVPSDMLSDEHLYRLAFEIGELSARSGVLTATDGNVSYDVPLSVASTRVVNMQLEEYATDESFIKKSPVVILRFANSVPNGTVGVDDDAGIVAEITANTAAIGRLDVDTLDDITADVKADYDQAVTDAHTHDNKTTLDMVTPEAFQAISDTVGDRHTHTNKAVIDAIETAPPQIYNKYYANDGVSGRVLMDAVGTTAVFGAVTDFIPDTAKIIDISVRYTADAGVTVTDVALMGGYYFTGFGGVMLLANVDSFSVGNNTGTFTVNDASVRPYLRVYTTRSANTGAIIRAQGSNNYILGFTVTYIEG